MSATQRAIKRHESIAKREQILITLDSIARNNANESVRQTATNYGLALANAIDMKITKSKQNLWQEFMVKVNQFISDYA